MPSRWRSGPGAATSPGLSITLTAASSTSRSATPSASPTPGSRPRSDRRATASTTPSPRPSTACTRPSSSGPRGPGGRQTRSSSRPPPGWPGGTTSGSTPPAATFHPPSSRRPTIITGYRPPRPPETQSLEPPRNPVRFSRRHLPSGLEARLVLGLAALLPLGLHVLRQLLGGLLACKDGAGVDVPAPDRASIEVIHPLGAVRRRGPGGL